MNSTTPLLTALREQKEMKMKGNIDGYLTDTCLTAQDQYKAALDYFRIQYI